jgi:hypothetical protein
MQMGAPYVTERESALERRAYRGDREAMDALADLECESPEDRALASMDTFGDWFGAELYQAKPQHVGYVPAASAPQHIRDNFALMLEGASTPYLAALALQGNEWAGPAMTVIRERYLAVQR